MTYALPAPGLRIRAISRRLTLIIAASAVALTALASTARPARADTDEILRFLTGAIIIGAIAGAINENHTPNYQGRYVLPDSCLEVYNISGRQVQTYNAGCLSRGGYNGLPSQCYRDFGYHGGRRGAYVAECLFDAGYQRDGFFNPPAGWIDDRIAPPVGGPYGQPYVVPSQPPRHGVSARLPSHCAMHYRAGHQRIEGFWGNCLDQAGFDDLPRHCRVNSTAGDRIYTAQCLYDAGYRRPR